MLSFNWNYLYVFLQYSKCVHADCESLCAHIQVQCDGLQVVGGRWVSFFNLSGWYDGRVMQPWGLLLVHTEDLNIYNSVIPSFCHVLLHADASLLALTSSWFQKPARYTSVTQLTIYQFSSPLVFFCQVWGHLLYLYSPPQKKKIHEPQPITAVMIYAFSNMLRCVAS